MVFPSSVERRDNHVIPIHLFHTTLSIDLYLFVGSRVLSLLSCSKGGDCLIILTAFIYFFFFLLYHLGWEGSEWRDKGAHEMQV